MKLVKTNAIQVKHVGAFLAWAKSRDLEATAVQEIPGDFRFVLTPGPGRDPVQLFASLHISEESVRIVGELAAHLAEGEVAFVYSLGNDAMWISWDGKARSCDLEQVYRLAGERLNARLKPTTDNDPAMRAPRRLVVAFGSEICEALEDHRPIDQDCKGSIQVVSFENDDEMGGFFTGIDLASGEDRCLVVADSVVGHLFFEALEKNPGLDYRTWYNHYLKQPDSFYLAFPPECAS